LVFGATPATATRKIMISFASGIALLLGLALSAGCASQYDARHRYEDGWRASDVLKVAPTPNQLESAGIDCSKSTVQSPVKGRRYAYIRYLRSFAPRHAIVVVPEHVSVIEGDRVFFNIYDCTQAIVPIVKVSFK
jgi:hypothetical protein